MKLGSQIMGKKMVTILVGYKPPLKSYQGNERGKNYIFSLTSIPEYLLGENSRGYEARRNTR